MDTISEGTGMKAPMDAVIARAKLDQAEDLSRKASSLQAQALLSNKVMLDPETSQAHVNKIIGIVNQCSSILREVGEYLGIKPGSRVDTEMEDVVYLTEEYVFVSNSVFGIKSFFETALSNIIMQQVPDPAERAEAHGAK